MYIPKAYKSENQSDLIQFIKENSFGILISNNAKVEGTHLPFIIEKRENELVLISHLALNNPQVNKLQNENVLTIFQGPHCYISPLLYERKNSVPTWNYQCLHIYGELKRIKNKESIMEILDKMVGFYDPAYHSSWKNVSKNYMERVLKAVIGIEIKVKQTEFCEKLSQDRSSEEQENIINQFSKSESSNEKSIAKRMNEILIRD